VGPSDADLVARVLAHDDRHAFAALVRRYQSPVRGLLRRLTAGDAAWADDLAQETFVRAWRGLRRWRGEAGLSTWLYRIAFNVFASEAEKRARRATDVVADVPEAATEMEGLTLRRDLSGALACLSPAERAVVALTYAEGATNEEVAETLQVPLGTVKTHLHRAKARLREVLRDAD
jgi:RNA polymerase sigma-70 factor (ECF subfamily)